MTHSLKHLFTQQLNDFYTQQHHLSNEIERILNEVEQLEKDIAHFTAPKTDSPKKELPLPLETLGTYLEKMETHQKEQQLFILAAKLSPLQTQLDECLTELQLVQEGMKLCKNALVQAEQLNPLQEKEELHTLVEALNTKK